MSHHCRSKSTGDAAESVKKSPRVKGVPNEAAASADSDKEAAAKRTDKKKEMAKAQSVGQMIPEKSSSQHKKKKKKKKGDEEKNKAKRAATMIEVPKDEKKKKKHRRNTSKTLHQLLQNNENTPKTDEEKSEEEEDQDEEDGDESSQENGRKRASSMDLINDICDEDDYDEAKGAEKEKKKESASDKKASKKERAASAKLERKLSAKEKKKAKEKEKKEKKKEKDKEKAKKKGPGAKSGKSSKSNAEERARSTTTDSDRVNEHRGVPTLPSSASSSSLANPSEPPPPPLVAAAARGQIEIVRKLLLEMRETGDESARRSAVGNTALHVAAMHGHSKVCEELLTHGACLINEVNDEGQTPLHLAAREGRLEAVRLLLRGAHETVLNAKDVHGHTPLHLAVIHGDPAVVELLLYRSDPNIRDNDGRTALHIAIAHHSTLSPRKDIIRFLIMQAITNVDVDCPDNDGNRPLHLAAKLGHTEAMEWLYEAGTYLESLNNLEQTPLHLAAQEANRTAVKVLVRKGASLYAKDAQQRTPEDLAPSDNKNGVAVLLKNIKAILENKGTVELTMRSEVKNKTKIHNIVFQGGGVRGIAYVGAIRELYSSNKVAPEDIKRVGGTSAGAILALLVGLNLQPKEMEKILMNLKFENFLDGSMRDTFFAIKDNKLSVTRGLWYLLNGSVRKVHKQLKAYKGLFEGEAFRLWLNDIIEQKTGIVNATFKELHDEGLYKDLYFVGTNLVEGQTEVFSYEHTPNVIISDAVRISMSIPLLFRPHRPYIKNAEGKRVVDETKHDYWVDGALQDNYPIWLFDRRSYMTEPENKIKRSDSLGSILDVHRSLSINEMLTQSPAIDSHVFNKETLGFRLVPAAKKKLYEGVKEETDAADAERAVDEKTGAEASNSPRELDELHGVGSYIWAVMACFYNKEESDHRHGQDACRTIYIPDLDIGTTDFNLDNDRQKRLMEAGSQAVRKYFEKRKPVRETHFFMPADFLSVLVQHLNNYNLVMGEHGLELRNMTVQRDSAELIYKTFSRGNKREIEFLQTLQKKNMISLNTRQAGDGNTAMHLAAKTGDINCVHKLLKAKAFVGLDVRNAQQETPLDVAMEYLKNGSDDDSTRLPKGTTMVTTLVIKGARKCQNPKEVEKVCEDLLRAAANPKLVKALDKFRQHHREAFFPGMAAVASNTPASSPMPSRRSASPPPTERVYLPNNFLVNH